MARPRKFIWAIREVDDSYRLSKPGEPGAVPVGGLSYNKSNREYYSIVNGKRKYWGRDFGRAMKAWKGSDESLEFLWWTVEEFEAMHLVGQRRAEIAARAKREAATWSESQKQEMSMLLKKGKLPNGERLPPEQRAFLLEAMEAIQQRTRELARTEFMMTRRTKRNRRWFRSSRLPPFPR